MDLTDNDRHLGAWLAGAAVGALVMYMLDPGYGAPRRAAPGTRLREPERPAADALNQSAQQPGDGIDHAGTSPAGTIARVAREARATLKGLAERELGAPVAGGDGEDGNARFDGAAGKPTRSATGRAALPSVSASAYPSARPASVVRMAALAGGGLLGLFGLLAPRSLLTIAAGLAGIALLARASGRRPLNNTRGPGQRAHPVQVENTRWIDAPPARAQDDAPGRTAPPRQ